MNLKDEKILSAFEEKQSITGVHKITGYNWQQIAKVLSTYGIVANDTHEIILNLYDRGKNAKEISEITGYAETTVHAYLPRVRPAYNENISENGFGVCFWCNHCYFSFNKIDNDYIDRDGFFL